MVYLWGLYNHTRRCWCRWCTLYHKWINRRSPVAEIRTCTAWKQDLQSSSATLSIAYGYYQGCTLVLSVGFWTHDLMIILITWNSKIFSCLHSSVILWTLRIPLSLSDPSPRYSAFLGIVSFHLFKIFTFRYLYNLYQLPLSAILDLSVSIELFIRDLFVRCSSCALFRTWLMCLALILLQSICLPLGSWLREYETNQHRTERKTTSTPP